jgi:putative glutamine amidotransferase
VSGVSTLDDLPEAVELGDRRFVLGVQWHPEADPASRVIASFIDAARTFAERDAATAAEPGAETAEPQAAGSR